MRNIIKKNLTQFIPPILVDFIKFILKRNPYLPKYIYLDKYESYGLATQASKQKEVYLNDSYDYKIAESTCELLSKNHSPIKSYYFERDGFLLNLVIAIFYSKYDLNIVDFGGGSKPQFPKISNTISNYASYTIVDRDELIEKINQYKKDKDITFNKNLSIISYSNFMISKIHIDVCFFGSSIQYLDKSYETIGKLIKRGCKIFIISDSIFTNFEEDFYVLQVNIKNTTFPHKFHSKAKFINFMKFYGFELKSNWIVPQRSTHNYLKNNEFSNQSFVFIKNS